MQNSTVRRATPTKGKLSVLAQLCNLIPGHLVGKLARDHGVDQKARSFSAWSHVVAMLYAQLTHAIGLNDVCDALRHHQGWLSRIRGATPPSRNGFSHANKVRDAAMAETLFWQVLAHLQSIQPRFGSGKRGLAHRFKRVIHVVDSTTIQLVASCMDWAKHRRRKAAAKCHLRLDLQSLLPRFAIVDTARDNDNARARELCAGIRSGEIVIFDRAYVDFAHLFGLLIRGVSWVTRTKDNIHFRVVKRRIDAPQGRILRDDEVVLLTPDSRGEYPNRLRRITALVELDGKDTEMEFLSDNFDWAPSTIADLYRCRWQIGVSRQGHVFKSVKVRPEPIDSGSVAREAPPRESKAVKPSDNMLSKGVCAKYPVVSRMNAEVASSHEIPVAEMVDNMRKQQVPIETSPMRRHSPAGYQRRQGTNEDVETGEALDVRRRNPAEETQAITVSGKCRCRHQGDGSGRGTDDGRAAKRARRDGPGPVGMTFVEARQG